MKNFLVITAISCSIGPIIAMIIHNVYDERITKKEDKRKVEKHISESGISDQKKKWLIEYYNTNCK